jgi:hypothetical protein
MRYGARRRARPAVPRGRVIEERLAIEAIRRETECITLESFEALPTHAPLLSMEGRRAELVS